ncbi:MAG: signal peptidase I [Dysgonamonadaceae bacterium]|jgi:signal peptidase I|nr:signal peptidase I [Dysgonamonadaceae bacterium]
MRKATKNQWIFFSIVTLLYIAFVIWDGNYWLLLGIPVIFDIYISKIIPWGAWKKSENKALRKVAEWVDAIVFALVAVYFINIFIFQMYKIPSSSLEKTLLVGDYLVVNKFSYGPRVPNTPLSFPLVQHTFPIINTKSYIEWPKWGYKRLKGLGNVKRNDIVVFNFPAGDTVAINKQNPDYYFWVYMYGWDVVNSDKNAYGDIVYRPVDRRENFVKRCIGLPGDSLQIIENEIYIDGKHLPLAEKVQFVYYVETKGGFLTEKQFRTIGISSDDYANSIRNGLQNMENAFIMLGIQKNADGNYNPVYRLPLTQEAIQKFEKSGWIRSIHIEPDSFEYVNAYYPYGYETNWTRDNYGPIWIPKRGATVQLTPFNLALYTRCIVNYEGNSLEKKGDQLLINGSPATEYTFKYDYYFMMGDNRHSSADSRSWGFVPEDHIVGRPVLIWFSTDKDRSLFNGGIRWNRLFRTVSAQ